MIVSTALFVGKYVLPLGANSNLTQFIQDYEPEIIRRLLGQELGQLVIDDDDSGSVQRFTDLLDGKAYTDAGGVSRNWLGMKSKIIVPYVYCKYLQAMDTMVMPVGSVVPGTENAERVSNHGKIVAAWRDMVRYYMPQTEYYHLTSAYEFLNDNDDTYPEWEFTGIDNLTSLMI